jgi:N-acetylneuraminic acid mutarotase
MSIARLNATMTVLQDGRVLVVGGSGNGGPFGSAEIFDPTTGTWALTGGLQVSRVLHSATLLPNGKVLVAGGENDSLQAEATCELYDPQTGSWSFIGSLNVARFSHTATLLQYGRVLVAGGFDSQFNVLNSAELYDPQTGSWSLAGSMVVGLPGATATLLNTGKVLVTGGEFATFITELYDPATGTWTETGALHETRSYNSAALLQDGRVLVAGGPGGPVGGTVLASAEIYDPATGTWSTTGSLLTARYGQQAVLLTNGQVLNLGGSGTTSPGQRSNLASSELYDPGSGQWSATGSMSTPRAEHVATLLASGQVLVAGGFDAEPQGVDTSSAVLYTPGAPAQLVAIPGTANVAQKVGLSASRFASSEPVAFALDGTTLPLTTTSGFTGTLATTLTVPEATYGAHLLSAVGLSSTLVATATLQVRAGLALGAYSGTAGSTDTAVGTGFGASEPVALHWNTPNGPTLGTTTTSIKGSFYRAGKITFTVPSGARGWHLLYGLGAHSGAVAATVFYER